MEPYAGLTERPLCRKGDVIAEMVVVFGNKRGQRALNLIAPYTRVVPLNEIHEFIITDEEQARPGGQVDRVAYLCFAEIKKGGAIMFGDSVFIEDQKVGRVVGFDETHMPNHINVIIYSPEFKSGFDWGFTVGQQMLFTDRK